MQECIWTVNEIEKALSEAYNGPLMRVDPRAYSDRREVPKYTLAEVSLYLGVKPSTLRDWFFGREYKNRNPSPPVATPAVHNPYGPSLSFYNLAEAHVLAATRQTWIQRDTEAIAPARRPRFGEIRRKKDLRISMQAVRRAIDYVSEQYPAPHPLITRHFYTDGKHLFIKVIEQEAGEQLIVNASQFGQIGLPAILDIYLQRIDRDPSGWPVKIYPLRTVGDEDRSIVIMSGVASGRPVVNGTGVRVEAIWSRAQAGDSIDELADDYGIEPRVIEKAISYFTNVKAA